MFNSINWSPKGQRVRQLVEAMGLRFQNVLFVDDNPSNRGEVKSCCVGITVEDIDIIERLIQYCDNTKPTDLEHKRLNQYKILERKQEFRAELGSNEEFLKSSHISVKIQDDCIEHIERITELVQRSNQLNFTKLRSTKKELVELIEKEGVTSGYVCVTDDFGDYGIVGFFCYDESGLIHYVFSCRTLGMGIEQYVYRKIGRPKLSRDGDVSSDVDYPEPTWITEKHYDEKNDERKRIIGSNIVVKGPCDMEIIFGYIAENKNIKKEFVYVNTRGVSIEGYNHTAHIVESITLNSAEKRKIGSLYSFCDDEMFTT